ncbi:thymidine kinase [Bacteroidota bacterium]|nr:thymidine kinase [Bacteroidota bacterium]
MKSHKGKIDIICGSMFSGKTEELIRRLKRLDFAKKKYKLFKPIIDSRYDNNKVVSHNMNSVQATIISKSEDIYKHIKNEKIIAIDEAQFLDEKLYEVCKKLIKDGIDIILVGLDMDYKGEPFGSMPKLLAISDDVKKMHAVCFNCGEPANYTFRTSNDTQQVLIGSKENYKALCKNCFFK